MKLVHDTEWRSEHDDYEQVSPSRCRFGTGHGRSLNAGTDTDIAPGGTRSFVR